MLFDPLQFDGFGNGVGAVLRWPSQRRKSQTCQGGNLCALKHEGHSVDSSPTSQPLQLPEGPGLGAPSMQVYGTRASLSGEPIWLDSRTRLYCGRRDGFFYDYSCRQLRTVAQAIIRPSAFHSAVTSSAPPGHPRFDQSSGRSGPAVEIEVEEGKVVEIDLPP